MYAEHVGHQTRGAPIAGFSGANGGNAKPRDDGRLIRQWCPSPTDFGDNLEDRGTPPTESRHARMPEPAALLN